MRTTFSVVSNNFLYKTGLDKIRSGDILSLKIIENKNGIIKAAIKGGLLTLKGSKLLTPDTILRVRAEWNGKTLLLSRIDKESSIKQLFNTYSIKDDFYSISLFEAVKRSGAHLRDENIRLFKRLLRNKKELNKEEARTAAEVVKKGLSADGMIDITGAYSKNNEENRDKTLLFNHLHENDELWFIVPYSFSAETKLDGNIRIRKNIKSKDILSVVIDVRASDGRYFFLIENYSSKNRKLKVFAEGHITSGQKKQIKKLLPEILGNLSIKYDDNIKENCFGINGESTVFDGFSEVRPSLSGVEEVI